MASKVQKQVEINYRAVGLDAVSREVASVVKENEKLVRVRESDNASLTRIINQYDKAARATRDYERAQATLARVQSSGTADLRLIEQATNAVANAQARAARSMNDNASGVRNIAKAMSDFNRQQTSMIGKLDAWSKGNTGTTTQAAPGLARHELINLGRQAQDIGVSLAGGQSPLTVLAQQGSQVFDVLSTHKGGVGAAIKSLGDNLMGLVTPGRLATASIIGGMVAVEAAASRATSALADLGRASSQTGLAPSSVAGAQIVGAGAGMDRDTTRSALENANRQFEAYRRNGGDVLESLSKIDKGFLSVADRAKNAGEFIDAVGKEIQKLPREEGLDLSQRLFGVDAGTKLFENLRGGELSMKGLADEAGRAGKLNDDRARRAAEVQKEIDKAAEIANTKLLVAFQDLGNPVDNLKMSWYGVVGAMADVVAKSQTMQRILQGFLHPIDTMMDVPKTVTKMFEGDPQFRGRFVPIEDPFDKAKASFFAHGPKMGPMETAGASRARYEARGASASKAGGRSAGGVSDAEREAVRYANVTKEMEQQLRLAGSLGDEHKKVQAEIDKENYLAKLGKDASKEHRDHVADLADKIAAARAEQDKLNQSVNATKEAYGAISQTMAGSIKDIIKGGKPADALSKALDSIGNNAIDAVLTGSGPLAKMFGVDGKNGGVGGIFGAVGSLFGLGGDAKTSEMNVTATNVNLNGGIGGTLASGMSGIGGQVASGAGSIAESIIGAIVKALPAFAAFDHGGIVGAPGGRMMRAPVSAFVGAPHFAKGGAVPVIAHAGEVILNAAQQRNVAAALGASRGRGNSGGEMRAAPVTVNLIGAPEGTKVKDTTDRQGARRVDVVFDERAAAAMSSPQGEEAMKSAYGVAPRIAFR